MRTRIALLALAGLLAATGTATAKPSPPRGPKLAGTTVITATRPSVVGVNLPGSARLTFQGSRSDVALSGDGRAIGVAIVGDTIPAGIVALAVGDCATAACRPTKRTPLVSFPGFADAVVMGDGSLSLSLKPGHYDVYVLTDGAPVTVRLTLSGLRGSTSIAAREPAALQWAVPGTTLPAGSVTATGEAVGTRGLMASAVVVDAPANAGGVAAVCWEQGPTAPRPDCRDADYADSAAGGPASVPFGYLSAYIATSGTWTQRVSYATAVPGTARVVHLWLGLGGPAKARR